MVLKLMENGKIVNARSRFATQLAPFTYFNSVAISASQAESKVNRETRVLFIAPISKMAHFCRGPLAILDHVRTLLHQGAQLPDESIFLCKLLITKELQHSSRLCRESRACFCQAHFQDGQLLLVAIGYLECPPSDAAPGHLSTGLAESLHDEFKFQWRLILWKTL